MNEQFCQDKKQSDNLSVCGSKCISWTAIFTSSLVGFGLTFLFNLFALSIGLTAFTAGPDGNTVLVVGGFLGLVLAAFVSMFVTGWIAGYLGRAYCAKRNMGELYGFSSWCLVLLLTVVFVSNISQLFSHYNYIVDRNITTISYTNNQAAPIITEQTKMHANNTSSSHLTVNTDKATNAVGQATFIIFFLFFIGALASMFGGRLGMCCKK